MSAPAGDLLAAKLDRPGAGEVEPGEDVHEGRLAGAVRPNKADNLVPMELERDVLQRADTLERA
jgi:hypothetical protein